MVENAFGPADGRSGGTDATQLPSLVWGCVAGCLLPDEQEVLKYEEGGALSIAQAACAARFPLS